jgi:hypothetical protein
MCAATGGCKITDDLPRIADMIAEADGVIFGANGFLRKADDRTQALIDRIGGYFPDPRQLRLPGMGPSEVPQTNTVRAAKRAVVITACRAPEPLATFFGYTTGPMRELRKALGSGGYKTIGSLSMTDTWFSPDMDGAEQDQARSLGRVLAGRI